MGRCCSVDVSLLSLSSDRHRLYPVQPTEVRSQGLLLQGWLFLILIFYLSLSTLTWQALLCHLCVDSLNATHALSKYEDQYPAFTDSREAKLIKTLTQEIENQDVEAFTEAVKQYDSISRLDSWHTTLLLKVKKQLGDTDDLR